MLVGGAYCTNTTNVMPPKIQQPAHASASKLRTALSNAQTANLVQRTFDSSLLLAALRTFFFALAAALCFGSHSKVPLEPSGLWSISNVICCCHWHGRPHHFYSPVNAESISCISHPKRALGTRCNHFLRIRRCVE